MNWTNTPPWTSQVSVKNRYDALDCLCESLGNVIYQLTGFDSSPRFWAKLSRTGDYGGNTVVNVLATVKKYGILSYELWPTPEFFDHDIYYTDIPKEIMARAIPIDIKLVPFDLNVSPGWTQLVWGKNLPVPTRHMVDQINDKEYFDSEWGSEIKPLNYSGAQIEYQTSLKVKIMVSAKIVRFADNKTMGIMIDSPNGTQIIKATNEEQFRSWNKPDSYGKPTVNPDGKTNWDCVEHQLNF